MSWTASVGGVIADTEEAMDKITEAFHEFVDKVRLHTSGEPWGGLTGPNTVVNAKPAETSVVADQGDTSSA